MSTKTQSDDSQAEPYSDSIETIEKIFDDTMNVGVFQACSISGDVVLKARRTGVLLYTHERQEIERAGYSIDFIGNRDGKLGIYVYIKPVEKLP